MDSLAEPNARAASILFDELDAVRIQCCADFFYCSASAAQFSVGKLSRAIVGSEIPEWCAKSYWDQPRSARAALTCRMVINLARSILIEFLLTERLVQFNRISIN